MELYIKLLRTAIRICMESNQNCLICPLRDKQKKILSSGFCPLYIHNGKKEEFVPEILDLLLDI
ncbi:MAG: hypothetical protein P8Y97_19370 [Candidatus Lokiarchaeota archaeon]